jgi:hypothetical protein
MKISPHPKIEPGLTRAGARPLFFSASAGGGGVPRCARLYLYSKGFPLYCICIPRVSLFDALKLRYSCSKKFCALLNVVVVVSHLFRFPFCAFSILCTSGVFQRHAWLRGRVRWGCSGPLGRSWSRRA